MGGGGGDRGSGSERYNSRAAADRPGIPVAAGILAVANIPAVACFPAVAGVSKVGV